MSKRHLIASTLAATATAVILSACSSSGTSPSHSSMPSGSSMSMAGTAGASTTVSPGAPASGPHNAADVAFATDMIPHHAQALQMAKLALSKASSPQVKALAQRIEAEQTPEISSMSGWLTGWNKPVPSTSGSMHMGATSMPGMMSDADMATLDAATGSAFDKLFLTQMITRHTGALTMARTELSAGRNGDAKSLATSIIAGQSNEITEMKALLLTIT